MPRRPLSALAHARSGDKGPHSNVGLVAYSPEGYAVLKEQVTAEKVRAYFEGIVRGEVIRYELDNLLALNFILGDSLGGGGSESLLERIGWVATLTLSRPKVNALSRQMVAELAAAAKVIAADDDCSVVVITSDQPHFCAGADLKERQKLPEEEVAGVVAAIGAMINDIARLPQPSIASIYGTAVGGGAELALACDLRIMGESGQFGLNETSLGIIPGAGGTQRLTRLIGPARASALIYSAELMDASQCLVTGAVNRVVPDRMLRSAAQAWAEAFAENAPLALRAAKRAILEGADKPLSEGLEAEAAAYRQLIGTQDRREGMAAYLEKRRPQWQGS